LTFVTLREDKPHLEEEPSMTPCPRALATALTMGALALYGKPAKAQYAAPPPVVAPQSVYVQPQPVAYHPVQRFGRFRYGADVGTGWAFIGPLSGFGVTGSLRLGWQINDNWAAYYQGDIPIGLAAGDYLGRSYDGAAIVIGTGFMGEYTLGDILSLGIGPSIDYGVSAVCSSTTYCFGREGIFLGVQARVAVTLLAASAGAETSRRGFRLGLSSHTTFMGDLFQALNIHFGYEWY
jgi:hypothetical protein